ncbi:MAG: hypothetical protein WKF97_15960 [Chitinophagaceae bacterium]
MKILEDILTDISHRNQLVKIFQEQVWNDRIIQNESHKEILSELAYDLDLYEPDENLRKQDLSYFGDERLEAEIITVLQKLRT